MRRSPRTLALALLFAVAGCGHEAPLLPRTAATPEVRAIDVGRGTNAFVVMGARPILVDTGWASASSHQKLSRGLTAIGVKPTDLALIVLTHGHGDHAGGANYIRQLSGAKVAAGQGDVEMLKTGHNRPLHPMGFMGRLVRGYSDKPFEPTTVDLPLTADLDLTPFGIDGRVVPAAGHTPGSVAVVLATGDALVGDLFRGSVVSARSPERHFFHDDCFAAEQHIGPLIHAGSRRFFVGHGGPIDADAVIKKFRDYPCPKN